MPKIQSQAGTSLADTYDIEGSIAGIENLESRDVSLVDEMGGRVFSERLLSFNLNTTTGNLSQNVTWAVTIGGFPDSPNRIINPGVIIEATGNVAHCSIAIRNTDTGNEVPIFVWDDAVDAERVITWSNAGAGALARLYLVNAMPAMPALNTRFGNAEIMGDLIFRGLMSAFGGGTVEAIAVLHFMRANRGNPQPGEPSSHGLPLPSW